LFQLTSERLCEQTTFGSVFMSTAIGLSEPDQVAAHDATR